MEQPPSSRRDYRPPWGEPDADAEPAVLLVVRDGSGKFSWYSQMQYRPTRALGNCHPEMSHSPTRLHVLASASSIDRPEDAVSGSQSARSDTGRRTSYDLGVSLDDKSDTTRSTGSPTRRSSGEAFNDSANVSGLEMDDRAVHM